MIDRQAWQKLVEELGSSGTALVAVSKSKPVEDVKALYELGQRDFGENYVQELVSKQAELPPDIRWHFIGHLQRNKVRAIAPFVSLIHAVDSFRLLLEINKEAAAANRCIDILLQMHIAEEPSKFGLDEKGIIELLEYYDAQRAAIQNIRICGLMGMSTATEDEGLVRQEFRRLHGLFLNLKASSFLTSSYFNICSMGMSGDYRIAVSEGSNMVRIGSLLFGSR